MSLSNGTAWTSTRHSSLESIGIRPFTVSVFASLLNLLSILTIKLPRKLIFKLILAPKLWLAYTNFFDITFLQALIPCSENCSPISLLDFLHTSSILSVHSHASSVSALLLDDSTCFFWNFSLYFLCNSNFYHKDGQKTVKKSHRPRRGPKSPKGLNIRQPCRAVSTAPALQLQSNGGAAGATAGG